MKRILLILSLSLATIAGAQISNLANLASGEMQMFTPIYEENEDVYGYFTLFKMDKLSENEEKYEYTILDKNLNKVANGEFVDVAYKKIYSRYYLPEKLGNTLLLTKRYSNTTGRVAFTSSRLLHLDNNEIGDPFYFENDTVLEGNRDINTIKKVQRERAYINVPVAANNGYLVLQLRKKNAKVNPQILEFYNLKNEKVWDYEFGGDKVSSFFSAVSFQEDALYFIYSSKDGSKRKKEFLQIDANTGQLNFRYPLEHTNSKYSYSYTVKKLGENTVLTGKISPYSIVGYNRDRALGLFKIVLDKNGNEILKKHFLWEDAGDFIEMNKKGKMEAGYKLFTHAYFVFNDERIVVLSEKYKIANNILLGPHVKTEDFILLEFDSNFDIKNVKVIEKDMSKFSSSDYLFGQYLNSEKDAVFFYQDYQKEEGTKDKNWILGIVSIVDGEINHEKIPMSSDDYFISPYIAKEGYILLREFNENSDFDEIRLERLNLD
ncbi:hypothetical protein EYD45_06260 [Hyunsoonleella flava]|uniref:DUF5103 domain-containing protein n=1 Tax=Hyunsoonleella flava TaxID=2527939 RepID=A0A4Q9FGA0_9FLAO|nr:DUF6770 family protein [Hyunsoonleella flava]TBN04860.1 hypothetical protein EYD45_06260 [Hyunsoonleella flava]